MSLLIKGIRIITVRDIILTIILWFILLMSIMIVAVVFMSIMMMSIIMTVTNRAITNMAIRDIWLMLLLFEVVNEPGYKMPSFYDESVEYGTVDDLQHEKFCGDDVEKMH